MSIENNRARSRSGIAAAVSTAIQDFRTAAHANGAGYDLCHFHAMTLIQCLYTIRYKNLDGQTAIGQGLTVGGNISLLSGSRNANGMFFGTQATDEAVKCFGIEHLWGNTWQAVDGLFYGANREIMTATQNFNGGPNSVPPAGYVNQGIAGDANISGFITRPQGTTNRGLLPNVGGGSATTHFCDNGNFSPSNFSAFGRGWTSAANAGAFCWATWNGTAASNAGARLMFL